MIRRLLLGFALGSALGTLAPRLSLHRGGSGEVVDGIYSYSYYYDSVQILFARGHGIEVDYW